MSDHAVFLIIGNLIIPQTENSVQDFLVVLTGIGGVGGRWDGISFTVDLDCGDGNFHLYAIRLCNLLNEAPRCRLRFISGMVSASANSHQPGLFLIAP